MSLMRRLAMTTVAAGLAALINEQGTVTAESDNPPVGRFVEIDGVRLHFAEYGKGDPVLYLHGNGSMIQEVEATGLVEDIARDHRLIVVDRPGFGHSSRPRGPAWTAARQASLFAALLEHLRVPPAVVIGHSWGAMVALAMAMRRDDRVCALVLVSGYYYPVPRSDRIVGILASPVAGEAIRHTVAPLLARAMAPQVIARFFAPNPVTPRFEAHYPVSLAVRPSQLRAFAEETGLMQPEAERLCPYYSAIACPAAIIAGRSDRVLDWRRHSERLAQDLPHADFELIDNVGHMLPHIRPDVVLAALRHVSQAAPLRRRNGGDHPPRPAEPAS